MSLSKRLPNNDSPCLEHFEYRCARVADAVYRHDDLAQIGIPLATEQQQRELLDEPVQTDMTDGVKELIYFDERTGQFIIAFAGTDPGNINDWMNNFQQFAGLNADYYQQGVNLAGAIRSKYRNKVMLTGHSLGGGVAITAAVASQLPAVVFNPPSLHANTLRQFTAEQIGFAKANVKRFVVLGEILDIINHLRLVKHTRIGKKTVLYGSFSLPLSAFLSISALLKRFIPGVGPLIGIAAPLLEKSVTLHTMPEVLYGMKHWTENHTEHT
jgi:hypothetical protein